MIDLNELPSELSDVIVNVLRWGINNAEAKPFLCSEIPAVNYAQGIFTTGVLRSILTTMEVTHDTWMVFFGLIDYFIWEIDVAIDSRPENVNKEQAFQHFAIQNGIFISYTMLQRLRRFFNDYAPAYGALPVSRFKRGDTTGETFVNFVQNLGQALLDAASADDDTNRYFISLVIGPVIYRFPPTHPLINALLVYTQSLINKAEVVATNAET